jgi:EpsG family
MVVYFTLLFIVSGSAFIARNAGNRAVARFFVCAAFTSMVLVAGLRGRTVGSDTKEYTDSFKQQSTLAHVLKESSMEPGYLFLKTVAREISDDYWALLIMIAVVAVFCFMRSIYLYSVNPVIALFTFITMGYYTFFFNGARQGLACAVYALALGALIEGNFKKYCLWVMLAFFFHKTVIIALPLYFLFRQKTTFKYVLLMVIISVGSVFFMGTIFDLSTLISDKYAIYQTMEATGGKMLTLFYALLSVFFLFFRPRVPDVDRRIYDCFLNMFILGASIYISVTLSGAYVELTRIAFYFQIASIFLWPIIFRNIYKASAKRLLSVGVVFSHLIFFYIFLDKMAGLTPFRFNEVLVRLFA